MTIIFQATGVSIWALLMKRKIQCRLNKTLLEIRTFGCFFLIKGNTHHVEPNDLVASEGYKNTFLKMDTYYFRKEKTNGF